MAEKQKGVEKNIKKHAEDNNMDIAELFFTAHKIGIVVDIGPGTRPHKLYKILWLHNGTKINISGKHLTLAYTID